MNLFPMSSVVNERASEQMSAAERSKRVSERREQTRERRSKWPSTLCVNFIVILPKLQRRAAMWFFFYSTVYFCCNDKFTRFKRRLFLDASSHLYMRVCPSVGPSVRPSVRPSVHLSVYPPVRPPVCHSVRPSVLPSVHLSLRR